MNVWTIFDNMTATELIKFFGMAISLLVAINAGIIKLFNWLEKWRQKKNNEEKQQKMINSIDDIQNHINLICIGMRLILADNLNRKCKTYLRLNYIPADEFDEFVSEFQTYKLLDSESAIIVKIQKVLDTLEVQSEIE